MEFDVVREQRGLGSVFQDVEAAVVVEGRAYVESVTGWKSPRLACVGIVVYEDFA